MTRCHKNVDKQILYINKYWILIIVSHSITFCEYFLISLVTNLFSICSFQDLFSQLCNNQGFLDRKRLNLFLQEMLRVMYFSILGWGLTFLLCLFDSIYLVCTCALHNLAKFNMFVFLQKEIKFIHSLFFFNLKNNYVSVSSGMLLLPIR